MSEETLPYLGDILGAHLPVDRHSRPPPVGIFKSIKRPDVGRTSLESADRASSCPCTRPPYLRTHGLTATPQTRMASVRFTVTAHASSLVPQFPHQARTPRSGGPKSAMPQHWKTMGKRGDGPTPQPTAHWFVRRPYIVPCLLLQPSTSPSSVDTPTGPTPPCAISPPQLLLAAASDLSRFPDRPRAVGGRGPQGGMAHLLLYALPTFLQLYRARMLAAPPPTPCPHVAWTPMPECTPSRPPRRSKVMALHLWAADASENREVTHGAGEAGAPGDGAVVSGGDGTAAPRAGA
ncbi:hypothetical protein BD779DRAFT_1476420 [Infundibulicybe gibba]|nr:hypothetical protein BD779DRAFT_1476420 [Infundibulicybe gibba]